MQCLIDYNPLLNYLWNSLALNRNNDSNSINDWIKSTFDLLLMTIVFAINFVNQLMESFLSIASNC